MYPFKIISLFEEILVMKKLFIIRMVAIASSLMMSCSKDFIDLLPTSSVSVDVVYKTDKDFLDALTATYNTLQQQYQNFYIFGDIRGDDSWQSIYKNNSWSYSDAFVIRSSDPLMHSTWQNYYQAIFRINTILSKIEAADVSGVPNKARYVAEAKFLRALSYFDLVRIFGPVPMVTSPLSIEEGYKVGREKVNTIYEKVIIPDLMAAENVLPLNFSGKDVGRPTKGAAKSLLGKVYLTLNDFAKAETKLQEVTTMNYALLPNYKDLFDYTKNEHHSEYIFDIEYEEGIGEGNRLTNAFAPNSQPFTKYYGIGGNGDEQNSPSQALINLFDAKDRRKDITVGVTGGFYGADSVFIKLPANTNQTYTKKYLVPVVAANDSRANWKVIRYADVLLMYAEALNENGKTSEALIQLNKVRTRAGLAGYAGLTKEDAREKIATERRLELSFEGHRWFDLVRTGQAFNVMKNSGMLPYMTVFPVPLSQIQLINNNESYPQNEGYD
ncbi:MAG: RagB/SusD family nutrient uptake outer membrane protein [Segetibacter sp.]|jgi:tetratricopeptide (TPR) repeat protein|nr:RagB/SusD family nutrient uptake outer membrane protein [Segetibacter sp.]